MKTATALDTQLQVKLAEACRVIAHAGLAEDILGHVSFRTDDGVAVRCRGEQECGLLFTQKEDICEVVDGAARNPAYRPPNELPIHTKVLEARPDVNAVVHAHAPHVVAADLAGLEMKPIIGAYNIPAMRMAAGGVPIYPRSLLINTDDLGTEIAEHLGGAPALILRGHGVVTVGDTVEEAVVRAINMEILAKMQVLASVNGEIKHRVTEEDMALMPDLGSGFNDHFVWRYHQAKLAHAGFGLV